MKILNVDENHWVAQGLNALLTPANHELIACASLTEAKRVLFYQHIDVLILELKTKVDHIEETYAFLCLLRTLYPHIRIIILTEITETALLNFFASALKPAMVLTKKTGVKNIFSSLQLPAGNLRNLGYLKGRSTLSRQEFNMLKWFAQYSCQKDIATRLNLNNKTISHYKRSLYVKLRCENNVQFHERLTRYGFI